MLVLQVVRERNPLQLLYGRRRRGSLAIRQVAPKSTRSFALLNESVGARLARDQRCTSHHSTGPCAISGPENALVETGDAQRAPYQFIVAKYFLLNGRRARRAA